MSVEGNKNDNSWQAREEHVKEQRRKTENEAWASKRNLGGRKGGPKPESNPGVMAEDFEPTAGNGMAGLVSSEIQKEQSFHSNRKLWGRASKTETAAHAGRRLQNEPYREPFRNPDQPTTAVGRERTPDPRELKPYKFESGAGKGLGFQGHAILPGEKGAGEVELGPAPGDGKMAPQINATDPEAGYGPIKVRGSGTIRPREVKTRTFDKVVGPKRLYTTKPGGGDGQAGKFPLVAPEAWTKNKRKIQA
jgi:hypothetical protein